MLVREIGDDDEQDYDYELRGAGLGPVRGSMRQFVRRVGLLGAAVLALATPGQALIPLGRPAPAWSGKTITGKPLSSAQFKGKVVLLNFFGNY